MCYTEEQIKRYLDILYNYTKKPVEDVDVSRKVKCWNCHNSECFFIESGYNICDSCGTTNGHVLGYYDVKDYDRLYFRKKSIYQRKYHYEKKVDQVSMDEKCIYQRKYHYEKKVDQVSRMKSVNCTIN